MPNRKIYLRQLLALLFAGLISPAAAILPRETATVAYGGAWLAPLLALPAGLAVLWVFTCIFRRLPEGTGFTRALESAFGAATGRVITGLYLIWTILLLVLNVWLTGRRLLSAGYQLASPGLFLTFVLAAALWLGVGRLERLAVSGEIFFLILTFAVGIALLLALPHIKVEYVLSVWSNNVPETVAAAFPVFNVLLFALPAAFLGEEVKRKPGDAGRAVRWFCAFCGLLMMLFIAIQGQFGPALTARMQNPFLKMVAGVGIRGAFQRLEAVLSALWVLGDLALLGFYLFACRRMASYILGGKDRRWPVAIVAILALAGALRLLAEPQTAEIAAHVVRIGGLILALFLPVLVLLALTIRKKT